jgi:hypothetical protein
MAQELPSPQVLLAHSWSCCVVALSAIPGVGEVGVGGGAIIGCGVNVVAGVGTGTAIVHMRD